MQVDCSWNGGYVGVWESEGRKGWVGAKAGWKMLLLTSKQFGFYYVGSGNPTEIFKQEFSVL